MKDLVIGDLHFGVKTNSTPWMTKQLAFLEQQVIPLINSHDRVIFLGDIFDIRYSINTQIGCEVKNIIRKMLKSFPDKDFYMIAGNHDYYSPIIDFEQLNAYELVFGEEFLECHKNCHIVSSLPLLDNRTLMLPWYFTENDERYEQVMKEYRGQFDIIYCHTDCEHWPDAKSKLKGDAVVYSGHIHYPFVNKEMKLYNIGAACAFTFNDVNASRYIYTIENGIITKSYENVTTQRFRRYYNEQIFSLGEKDFTNTSVQLYITPENKNKASYRERIREIKSTYVDCDIKVVEIDDTMQGYDGETADLSTNIQEYIRQNMPSHLNDKFELLTDKINETL